MNRKKRFNKRSIVAILFFLSAFIMPAGRAMAAVDNNPLCFTAKGGAVRVRFEIKNVVDTIQTSTDNITWSDYVKEEGYEEYPQITLSKAGDKVYFRAKTYQQTLTAYGAADEADCSRFYFTRVGDSNGTVEASGNIMSLFTPDCNSWVLPVNAFAYLFEGCTLLTKAPQLPAAELQDGVGAPSEYCYAFMFSGCTALTTAPELPATKLALKCYYSMFDGCTSLVTPPELPATDLKNYCYQGMFNGCTSLTAVPELPAETLVTSCYKNMFQGCTSLTYIPESELPATTLSENCYDGMFSNCTTLATIPSLPATSLPNQCYMNMFNGCSALMIDTSNNGTGKEWSIKNVTSSANKWNEDMFAYTGGNFKGNPVIGTTYYVVSTSSIGTKTTSSTATYWDVASSWDNGIPGDVDDVTISNSITIPDGINAHCNNITIANNCTLTVSPTATLHANTISSDAASKLLIKSDANGTGTVRFASGSPMATVEMYLKGVSEQEGDQLIPEWQYRGFIGQPDQNRNLSKVVIYQWFETTNDTTCWHQHYDGYKSTSATGNFDPWTGYSMANMEEDTVTKSYITTLIPTSGGHTYTLSRTTDSIETHRGSSNAPNCGVNLITNSYSAPLNLCNSGVGLSIDSVQNTYYFFNTRSNSAYHNDTASAITTYPGVIGKYLRTHSPYIPAGQSFAVKAMKDGATLRIPASAVSTINSGAMYAPRKEEEDARFSGLVKIVVESDDGIDDLYLLQVDNCSADFDNGYDGTKLFSSKAHQIYATNDYGKTAVNSDRTLLGQYIGFKPLVKTEQGWGRDGACSVSTVQMTISTRDLEGYEELYLYDRVADTYTKITEEEVTYTFNATGEENERRFQIVGKASDGTEYRPKAEPRIEVAGGEIWLMNFERTDARIIVTDATGKTLWSVNATEGTKFTMPELPKGVYIVSCGKVSTKYVQ